MRLLRCLGEDDSSFLKRKAYYVRFIEPRLTYSHHALQSFLDSGNVRPVDRFLKREIENFWRSYLGTKIHLIDFRWFDVFNSIEDDKDLVKYYMPFDFYYTFIDEYFTNPQHSAPCDDKNLYDLYFPEAKMPKTLFRKVDQLFLNDKYEIISDDEVVRICKTRKEVIIKKTRFSQGGGGVSFVKTDVSEKDLLKSLVSIHNQYICQDIIKQHPEINKLNDTSLNTIRIMTLVRDNKVQVLSPLIRVGRKGSKVDNMTGGGMACGINEDGTLKERVFDQKMQRYEFTPQGYRFTDIKIPKFERCKELVSKLAIRFSGITKLMSWDLAVDLEGDPVLIEMNLTYSGVDSHQLANGPIYGTTPQPIIEEVVNNSYTLRKLLRL